MTAGASPRVLVTRAAEDAAPLVHAITARGLEPVLVPLLARSWRIEDIVDLAASSAGASWVLLTSAAAVEVVAAAAPGGWPNARWAAVGPQTASRAQALGYRVDVTTAGTAVDLAAALGPVDGLLIALPRGDLAGDDLPSALRAAGAEVREASAYDNICPTGAEAALRRALPVDATLLMSGSAAVRLAERVAPGDRAGLGRVAAIGPSTREIAIRAGLSVDGMARPHTAGGAIDLVAGWFGR